MYGYRTSKQKSHVVIDEGVHEIDQHGSYSANTKCIKIENSSSSKRVESQNEGISSAKI